MIRVLVTEDEMPILRSTCTQIERVNPEFKVMYRAVNGQEALEILENQEVELLLLDIQMPIMDGVQLLKIMKERKIDVPTVVLSGYQDFTYVREALRCGAIDYILKPLKMEDLKETLAKIEKMIWSRKSKVHSQVIEENVHDVHERNYEVALLILGACQSGLEEGYTRGLEVEWNTYLETYMKDKLPQDSWWIIPGHASNECLTVFRKLGNRTRNLLEELEKDFQKDFQKEFKKKHRVEEPLTIVLSQKEHNHDSIYKENQVLHTLAKEVMFLEKGQISQDDVEDIKQQNKEQRNELRKYLMEMHHIEQIIPCMKKSLNHAHRRSVIYGLLKTGFWRATELFKGNYTYQELEEEIVAILEETYSKEILIEKLEKLVVDNFYQEQSQSVNKTKIAMQIKEYIDANYMRAINNHTLSEQYGYVPAHLRELFRKQYQVSPMDYLQELRLKKSEELLVKHQTLSLKEIAELVGFKDPLYFSKVFRKSYGMSPSEYRKKGIENES